MDRYQIKTTVDQIRIPDGAVIKKAWWILSRNMIAKKSWNGSQLN